jgi:DNA (cytosine-5)-methyltransferase 1/site-specific DNA-methyltransferase (adenine-specific)
MQFNVLDLFAGAGGFSAGLDKIKNMKTVVAVDFDKYATETFQKNFKDAYVITGDLTDQKIKDEIIKVSKDRKVNMIVGGPPCQGFSLKGKNLGFDDPRNFLFLEYYALVKAIKPEVFVIENVKNILNSENGYFKNQIIEKFSSLGYIINYGVLNAKNFGVPESRERAIIIGSLTRSIDLPVGGKKAVTVRDAISDLAYLESGEGVFECDYKNAPESAYQKKLRGKKLYNHTATNHSKVALEKLAMIPPEGDKSSLPKELHGKQKFATTWSRLQWDTYSPTIDTRFDTPSNGRNSHPFLNRSITPREAARIQSFDDDFIFYGPKSSVCKQIGNAVPPLLGKAIGDAVASAYQTERIKTDNYEIYLGNAYTMYKELLQNNVKVNHIITDPPYNISQDNNFSTMKNPRKGVDFGEWDKDFDLYNWISDYSNLLDKNGSMIIFCSYRFISHIIDKLETSGLVVKDVIIWKKSNPMPRNIDRRYVQDTEFAVWAVKKNAKWIFNKPTDKPYLRSCYETPTVSGKEKTNHPTQKSLKLMENIIKVHTNENDIILDPFMGSGSTGVASIKNSRKFVGIELDKDYFNIANDRLGKTKCD